MQAKLLFALGVYAPLTLCTSFFGKSFNIVKGLAGGLTKDTFTMSNLTVNYCPGYEDFGNMAFNMDFIESFGTRELKQNKVEMIPLEGVLRKDFMFTQFQSEIAWEGSHMMSIDVEVYEEYKQNDLWEYNLHWLLPYYAPNGWYTVEMKQWGLFDLDQNQESHSDDHGGFITVETVQDYNDKEPNPAEVFHEIQEMISEEKANIDESKVDYTKDQIFESVDSDTKLQARNPSKVFACLLLQFYIAK